MFKYHQQIFVYWVLNCQYFQHRLIRVAPIFRAFDVSMIRRQFVITLSKFFDCEKWSVLKLLKNRLCRHGRIFVAVSFENFLTFLKLKYNINPLQFLQVRMFTAFDVPYRLYVIKRSNRNYFFPGPIFSEKEQQSLILRYFSQALKKREGTLVDQFFLEVLYFLTRQNESILLRQLDQMLAAGMENRAYLHYRWLLKR